MLQLRPSCECCNQALPPDSNAARICSFECTFCAACAEGALAGVCPNCGGELVARPRRPADKLTTAQRAETLSWTRDNFTVSCDRAMMDQAMITEFLATSSYWAQGIPASTVTKSLANSLCFTLLDGKQQIGFARVITDYATIAYLGDVFIVPDYRGRGLSKWLMDCINSHPDLQGLRRWMLVTRDAQTLYDRYGFTPLKTAENYMERHNPDVYRK